MADEGDSDESYPIKTIRFCGSSRRILMQTKNGPCPLLAIANGLLLKNQLRLPDDARHLSLADLLQMITNYVLDLNSNSGGESRSSMGSAAFRGNFDGCLNVLPKLHHGMDINVQFKAVDAFEFTQELGIFDLLGIRLLHGWVVSQQDTEMYDLLKTESYNTLVERIFRLQAESPDKQHEAAVLNGWLQDTCAQLTYDGLLNLHEFIIDKELCVLFRNAHYTTVFKTGNRLYQLNTDIGFQDSELIWEQLDEVDGDTTYVIHDFSHPRPQPMIPENDEAFARRLQNEERLLAAQANLANNSPRNPLMMRHLEHPKGGIIERADQGYGRNHAQNYPQTQQQRPVIGGAASAASGAGRARAGAGEAGMTQDGRRKSKKDKKCSIQ